MSDFVKIRFEEGTEYLPCMLRVNFSPMTWNMAFKMRDRFFTDKEVKKIEARQCIQRFVYMLEKELMDALPEHLKEGGK